MIRIAEHWTTGVASRSGTPNSPKLVEPQNTRENDRPSNPLDHSNLDVLNSTMCIYCYQIISHGALAVL